jgi:hypothetical protein
MDNKKKPAARTKGQNDLEQLAYELSEKKGNVNRTDLDGWLEAERIVAEWLKNRAETENTKDAQEELPGT